MSLAVEGAKGQGQRDKLNDIKTRKCIVLLNLKESVWLYKFNEGRPFCAWFTPIWIKNLSEMFILRLNHHNKNMLKTLFSLEWVYKMNPSSNQPSRADRMTSEWLHRARSPGISCVCRVIPNMPASLRPPHQLTLTCTLQLSSSLWPQHWMEKWVKLKTYSRKHRTNALKLAF